MLDPYLIDEIDEIHRSAQVALLNKKFDAYVNIFADNLEYQQLSGGIIGKKQLAQQIRRYFDRINNFSGGYERKSISMVGDRIVEELIQNAKLSIRVFIFFSKRWGVTREAVYEWEKINNEWKIVKVEIIKEKIS